MNIDTTVVTALHDAASAADRLALFGVTVLMAYANGRRPVLVVDTPPSFVRGVIKRASPDGNGGIERVHAAPFYGVQIEWLEHVPAAKEVRHG